MIAHASLDAIVLRNKVAIVFMRLLDAITRDCLMRLFYSDCQPKIMIILPVRLHDGN